MKTKAAKKAADEDEAKSKKIRSSRSKRRRGRHSRSRSPSASRSGSDSPPRKRSKKPTKKIVDKKSKKNKGSGTSRRRHRSPSPSRSPSSSPSSMTRSHSRHSRHSSGSSSASERSVSPPPKSRSRDARKRKGRGRDRKKDRKRRKTRRSRSCSSSPASSGSSRSRSKSTSRKRRAGGTRDDASRDRIVQDYDNCHDSRTEKNSIEDVDRDEEAADATKGMSDIERYEKNVGLEKMESPPSKDSNETGEISSPKDTKEMDEILPAGSGSPEAGEDLELILRQKALENFRKFRGAVVMAGKTDNNGTGKEVLTDSPQNTVTKNAESRSAVAPFQRQGRSLGVSHSAGSPELEDIGNSTSPWKQEMSRGDGSPGTRAVSDASPPTQQQESNLKVTHSTSHIMSQHGRNGGSVIQRLGSTPRNSASVKQRLGITLGNSASVKQRLGSIAVVSPVQATPRVRSVVSIPAKEGLDGSTFTTTPMDCENPASVESSGEVGHPPVEINKLEGTNVDDRKVGEASAPDSSVLPTDECNSQAVTEDKDGSQFEKRTFSRMHDGETVQVSYKVYIPTKSLRLARRKLQR